MSAVVILAPRPGTKGASRAALAQRSRREPNTLLIVTTTKLLARGGTIERLRPQVFEMIAAAAEAGGYIEHRALVERLWGEDPSGGPDAYQGQIRVLLSAARESLDALSIDLVAQRQKGSMQSRRLVLTPITKRHAPTDIALRVGDPSRAHWIDRARAMRDRGATYEAIGATVNRAATTVSQALRGKRSVPSVRRTPPTPEAIQRGHDRREARREAKRTGEPVEQIYARWGCQTVDRSRLWDQRRAAAQEDRHP